MPGASQNLEQASPARTVWAAPADDGGSAILDWEVTFGSTVFFSVGLEYVNDRHPEVVTEVRAGNDVGSGPSEELTVGEVCNT